MTSADFAQPFRWVFLAALLALVGNCDANLQPYADNAGLFSIYGYLTLSDEPHYIRVKNLNDLVLDDSTKPLNATVTLEDLETGDTEVLVDSIVEFDGLYTHNFRSEMDIEAERTYEVRVERSDGRIGRATATMPPLTATTLSPATEAPCHRRITVEFPNVDNPRFIQASVGLKYGDAIGWMNIELERLDEGGSRARFTPASMVDEIVPENVTPFVDCDAEKYCNLLDDKNVRIAYTHFGPDWPADSTLARPLPSEVANGLGVFGGLRRDTLVATTNATLRCPGPETVPCRPAPRPCTSGERCFCPDV